MPDEESLMRTPKQERKSSRRLRRKMVSALEDVAYGLKFSQELASYGAGVRELAEQPDIKVQLQEMLSEELEDLFKEDE